MDPTQLRNFIVLATRTEAKRIERVKGLLPEDIQRLIDGTLGLDFLGDKYTFDKENAEAFFKINELFREYERLTNDGKRDLDFEAWLQELRSRVYARCHTRENIPSVMASVVQQTIVESTQYKPPNEEELKKQIEEWKKAQLQTK